MVLQAPLTEYNFEVRNVVEDLQDGIRLCRLAQLMSHDLSILGVGDLSILLHSQFFLLLTSHSSR